MNPLGPLAVVVAMFSVATVGTAQVEPNAGAGAPGVQRAPSAPGRGAAVGAELAVLVPRGDFAPGQAVSVGYGVRGGVGFGPRDLFDIGAAFRSVAHDSRTYQDTVTVKNMLRALTLDGRVTAPLRYVRPYLGASVGAAYFGTERSVERCCNEDGDREWELDGISLVRIRPTASARAGLVVDLWKHRGPGLAVLSLDLGVEDHWGTRTTYQTGGRGPMVRSGTNHRVYNLGVRLRSR